MKVLVGFKLAQVYVVVLEEPSVPGVVWKDIVIGILEKPGERILSLLFRCPFVGQCHMSYHPCVKEHQILHKLQDNH